MIIYAVFVDMQDMVSSGRDHVTELYKNSEDAERYIKEHPYTYIKEWSVQESYQYTEK